MSARADILARIGSRRVVCSVSGGKDSAAMCLYLAELGIEHDRVFADTGWEHAKTYEYLRGPLTAALGPITEVRGARLMVDLIKHKRMFPSRMRRFCTEFLKVKPLAAHMRALDVEIVNAVGIRSAESASRSTMAEWEWSDTFDCDVWRPLIRWTEQDVIDIHARHGLLPNPLYLLGATRVGCWPCIHARKSEIRLVADVDPSRIDEIRTLEAELTERAGSPRGYFQSGAANTAGRYEPMAIDDAVAWSRTSHGGRQYELFAAENEGCARWGMCEGAPPAGGGGAGAR